MIERKEPSPGSSASNPSVQQSEQSDGATPPRTFTQEIAAAAQSLPAPQTPPEDAARQRIAALEREARALGADPQAALLFHEIGLLWEDPLRNPRNAAVAFQNAFRAAPRFLPNILAARRLFADVGNWQMVVQLLDAELAATDSNPHRAALLFEKAQILDERLSREEDARKTYQQCLEFVPNDVSLLVQLEVVFSARNDLPRVVELQKRIASVVRDETLRAQYLMSAAEILEHRLERGEEAAAAYRQAFKLNRRDPLLLTAMAKVAEREGKLEELLDVLAAEAELLGAQAAPTYLRISKIYERLGRQEDALAALLAARNVNPSEPLVLSELSRIYESQKRYEELADVLLSWVDSVGDSSERASINLRLAALYEEELKRDAEAIERYREILRSNSSDAGALAGLGKLYHRTQNWSGLVDVFDAEIAASEEPRQKATRMYKAAEILEERLRREEDAIQRYNRCLQLQPGYLPAQKALTRLYERQGRFAELVAMHEQDLIHTTDRDLIVTTLNKIAAIYEDRLSDIEHAIETMKRVVEISPDHLPSLRHLARLYERAEMWKELITLQETEAGLVGDLRQVLSLHHRNAEILEEHLRDRGGAIRAYEQLLTLAPSYLPALKALGRLCSQEGRWEDLIRMYRAEAEIAPTPESAATLLYKIGELYEHRLRQPDDAVEAYREVLELVPSDYTALRAQARIHRNGGDWDKLVGVLRAESASRTDPTERANVLFQAATILEEQLTDLNRAVETYREVMTLAPGHAAGLRALERLFNTQGNVKELIPVLDRITQTGESPQVRASAYVKLAQLYLDRLMEPSRAAQCCDAALALDAANVPALKLLERIRGTDRNRRAEARGRLAERVTDPRLRAALKLSAAHDREAPNDGPHVEELRAVFAESSNDPRVAFALERALRRAGDSASLLTLFTKRLEATNDPSEKLQLSLRIAELCESKLGDLPKALTHYKNALTLAPGFLPALQGARRVQQKSGDMAAARVAFEAEGQAARDTRSSIEAYVAAGRLAASELGDFEGAVVNFRRALERDPLDVGANEALSELLAEKGDPRELALLHEKRAEARLSQKDVPGAAEEYVRAARIYLDRCEDRAAATRAVGQALEVHPVDTSALELKSQLALGDQQYAEAAAALTLRVQQGGDALALSQMHLVLGSIYQDHLSDVTRAAAHLQTALTASEGRSIDALDRLAAIHTYSRNWTGAADCLKQLLVLDKRPEAQAKNQTLLAKIVDEGFGDVPHASELYRTALTLAPNDTSIVDRLAELYERTGNLPELAKMLETQIAQAPEPARSIGLRLKLADLYAKPLDDPKRAIALLRESLGLDPNCAPARSALAELYVRDPATTEQAIEEYRHLLGDENARVDALHALFRLYSSSKQQDRAFCTVGVLQFLKAETEAETAFYNEHRTKLSPEKASELSEQERELVLHPQARNNVLVEILRTLGDQVSKIHPPSLEALGIDKKADRLKPDHILNKAVRPLAALFGVSEYDLYQTKRGTVFLETTDPLAICIGPDVVKKYNDREQKFLFGRAVMNLFNKAAVLSKLSTGQVADLLGSGVRAANPDYAGLGKRNEDTTKQVKKAMNRKALKSMEILAQQLVGKASPPDVHATIESLGWSADRAGLLLSGDVASGLGMLLRDDPNFSGVKIDSSDPVVTAIRLRPDLQEGLRYVLSDDFFRLRQRLGISLN